MYKKPLEDTPKPNVSSQPDCRAFAFQTLDSQRIWKNPTNQIGKFDLPNKKQSIAVFHFFFNLGICCSYYPFALFIILRFSHTDIEFCSFLNFLLFFEYKI